MTVTDVADQIEKARARRFRPYPEYRDSGVGWLGEIPARWNLKTLKNCVARLESGGTPESGNVAYWTDEEHGIPWVAISDMTRDFHLHVTGKRITEEGRMSKRLRILPVGTLLYSMYASLGKVALLETEAVINQAILGVVPRESEALRDYLRWWFEFMQAHIQMLSASNTQDNLSAKRVRNMLVVLPVAIEEQRSIATFLDRETANIDGLVAGKERLIELLQEKRTALITSAVTRGLDPNVPMKDSSVEWLGEIPAHWDAVRVKNTLTDRISGPFGSSLTKNSYGGHTYRVYGQEQVIPRDFSVGDYYIPEAKYQSMKRYAVQEGDVLLSCVGTFGRAAVVPKDIQLGIINPRLILLRPERSIIVPAYLECFLKSELAFAQLDEISHGGTMDVINLSMISVLLMPLPPKSEQHRLLESVRFEASRLGNLVAKIHQAIDHLKEFRTALISAAVTGKIDVREQAA